MPPSTCSSPNMSYTPSYKGFFNKTMPLFAPRTYRADDYNDPVHLERISTLNMFVTKDLGAIPEGECQVLPSARKETLLW